MTEETIIKAFDVVALEEGEYVDALRIPVTGTYSFNWDREKIERHMKMGTPKFKVGDTVYAFTESGLSAAFSDQCNMPPMQKVWRATPPATILSIKNSEAFTHYEYEITFKIGREPDEKMLAHCKKGGFDPIMPRVFTHTFDEKYLRSSPDEINMIASEINEKVFLLQEVVDKVWKEHFT